MIEHLLLTAFHFFRSLGIGGVFLSMLTENIGIPLPTELGYLIGQELINAGKYHYGLVLIVVTAGHVVGSMISYGLGRWGDSAVSRRIRRTRKIVQVHDRLSKWYKKYGNLAVFLARFVGYFRPWSSYVAGFAGVRFWPFFILTLVGSLIFNIFNLYFANIFILIWRKFTPYHFGFILLIGLTFFGFFIYSLVKFLIGKEKKPHK